MSIPFILYFPNGRRSLAEVNRPDEVEDLARKFIAHGGEYRCGILKGGKAKIMAVIVTPDGFEHEGDSQICDNGPDLMETVDLVIRTSQVQLAMHSDGQEG